MLFCLRLLTAAHLHRMSIFSHNSAAMSTTPVPPLPKECLLSVIEPLAASRKQGQTLIFLHGWPDTIQLLEQTQKHFAGLGYRTAAVGLPAYGQGVTTKIPRTFGEVDALLELGILHAAQGVAKSLHLCLAASAACS